jgi:hypothetical protein
METNVGVEEADIDTLSIAIRLLCPSHATIMQPVQLYCNLMCVVCVIINFVASNIYHCFYEYAFSGYYELFDSSSVISVSGI